MIDENTFRAYSDFEKHSSKTYLKKNVIYSEYEQKELSTPYPIQDLIVQGLVVEM